jgi:alpha-L-fucosidase
MSLRLTRREFLSATAAAAVLPLQTSRRPVPTASQLQWQRDELAMFLHFGVNTFTDREWGDGREDPAIFNPVRLDARQWAKTARAAGFRAMILTAKHHDGFCLWPTRTTKHSVASSPFRAGAGDLVREFVDACRAEGLRPGLYLSPWDRNHPTYGDSPRYNDVYAEQLTELLTNYGELAEVWFDGANGEGPNGKRQQYDWPRVWGLVRKLQPRAVMFSDAGPDVRWCGTETGVIEEPNWSTVDPSRVPYAGASGPGITDALKHGDPNGSVWRPSEADTSIRPGWFYHPADDEKVRTADALVNLYFSSVGRNSKLLLNVPPTREGLLHDVDVARLTEFESRLRATIANDVAKGRKVSWRATGTHAEAAVDLGREASIAVLRLEEDIARGQTIASFSVEGSTGGSWEPIAAGKTIGYARLIRVDSRRVRTLRVTLETVAPPAGAIAIRAYP